MEKLLTPEDTFQMRNGHKKLTMLSTYNNKTDIVFMFFSEKELHYDHRSKAHKQNILIEQFSEMGGRTQELLDDINRTDNFYFDEMCQIKMPSWTKGRIALVGDAAYCASPAAGMGGTLAIDGAAALADAFEKCDGDYQSAFEEYNQSFRPYIEEVQADAVRNLTELLNLKTVTAS